MVIRKSDNEGAVFGEVVCLILRMVWFGWWYEVPMAEDFVDVDIYQVRSWESLAKIMFGVYCSVKYRNWA